MTIKKTSVKNFDALVMEHPIGSKLELLLYGAHILSWRNQTGEELLMVSKCSFFERGKPIRGGVPVVFPQFSDEGTLPKHGFARTSDWKLEDAGNDKEGNVFVLLSLNPTKDTNALWKHNFTLNYRISLGVSLKLDFSILNNGDNPFKFQMAFHTYFSVPAIREVKILGLKGYWFKDFLTGGKEFQETNDELTIAAETDRVYKNVQNDVQLIKSADNGKIIIKKKNMPDVVVWNPWQEKAKNLPDFGSEEYLSMICIETGIIYTPFTLAPTMQWEGSTQYLLNN